jgi:DNA-binding response OmpR family regulator
MTESKAKVLVVEDEDGVRAGLVETLRVEGYLVVACASGSEGLEVFKKESPALVILDLMIPGLDGLEVCKKLRQVTSSVPIIMLTARDTALDKILGLELGADDYITKPYEPRELVARIKAVLRRSQGNSSQTVVKEGPIEELTFADVVIDFRTYRARKGSSEIVLSAKEFELIRFLAAQPDVPVTRNELLDQVWGYNSYPTTRTVDNFIARLRQKFEDLPDRPRHILTVHGVGYKFVLAPGPC